jgi:predicted amidohydrolase
MSNTVKVAVTQHEPVWFDLAATVEKTCRLIQEAADNGAKLVVFPEVWVPGYPAWIWYVSLLQEKGKGCDASIHPFPHAPQRPLFRGESSSY